MDLPDHIGKYRVVRRLAEGGMGEVFLVQQEGPGGFSKLLVLKRLLPHLAAQPTFVELFFNEARLAALLSHPNVVQIFELGGDESAHVLAMEYVHGKSLRAVLHRLRELNQTLAPELAAFIASQMLAGLGAAHHLRHPDGRVLQVVHRDVSPENVLLGFCGEVKVADFGIAKAVDQLGFGLTARGPVGKLAYMAPEQITGKPVDGRTDVYAAGAVLFEMLTGDPPYVAGSPVELADLIMAGPRGLRARLGASVPLRLAELIEQALSVEPDGRPASALALAEQLDEVALALGAVVTPTRFGDHLRELFPQDVETPLVPPGARTESGTAPLAGPANAVTQRSGAAPAAAQPSVQASALDDTETEHSPVDRAPSPLSRRRWPVWTAGVAAVATLSVALGAWLYPPRVEVRPTEVKLPAPEPEADAPLVEGAPPPAPTPVRALEPPLTPRRSRPPATLAFRVRPFAVVYVDGKKRGVTPMDPLKLPAGRHAVQLVNPEQSREARYEVTLRSGETQTIKHNFER